MTETISETIRRHAREKGGQLAYWTPRRTRNPTGKILKRVLREPYWKGRTRRVN